MDRLVDYGGKGGRVERLSNVCRETRFARPHPVPQLAALDRMLLLGPGKNPACFAYALMLVDEGLSEGSGWWVFDAFNGAAFSGFGEEAMWYPKGRG